MFSASGNRSSTPSFFDRGLPSGEGRPLPPVPEANEYEVGPTPPPPLRRRLLAHAAPRPRPLTWSEEQINMLQKQNKDLRQHIINQRRTQLEKEQLIASQQQQIDKFRQSEGRQEDLLRQFANTINVALEDLQGKRRASMGTGSESNYSNSDGGILDEMITIYNQL